MPSVRGWDHRTVALMDAVAAFWLVFWLVVAALTGAEVWSLSRLSDTAQSSAQAADRTGQALQQLSELPLVGEETAELGTDVRNIAAGVEERAQGTGEDLRRLSILLGVATFLVPTSPVLGFYVPARVHRRREVKALREQLGAADPERQLQAYLAHRALTDLSYAELREVSTDPVGDVTRGRHGALAAAELRRLGLPGGAGR